MRTMRWWQFGLLGGVVLSLATAAKLIRAIVGGAAGETEWGEAAGFAAAIFGMGLLCGAASPLNASSWRGIMPRRLSNV